MNTVRTHDLAVAPAPAQQRLGSNPGAGPKIDDRLVHEKELIVLQCALDDGGQRQLLPAEVEDGEPEDDAGEHSNRHGDQGNASNPLVEVGDRQGRYCREGIALGRLTPRSRSRRRET
jgi:hypothetical protein